MNCIECGEKIKHTDAYCPKCGTRQINPELLDIYGKSSASIVSAKQKAENKPTPEISTDYNADITIKVEKAGYLLIGMVTLLSGVILGICAVDNVGSPLFFGAAATVCTILSIFLLFRKGWALTATAIMYLIMMLGMIILLPAYAVKMDLLPSVIILMLISILFAVIILINALHKYSDNRV